MPEASSPANPEPINVVAYKTPKQIVALVGKVGVTKASQPWLEVFWLSILAGTYVGMGGLVAIMTAGGLTQKADAAHGKGNGIGVDNPGLVKLVFGATFPVALILLVVAGTDLFTGNCMYFLPPLFEKKIKWWQVLRGWGLSYAGNMIGCVLFAYFLTYLANFTGVEPYHTFILDLVDKKIKNGGGVNFLRAIGCNWLVCMACFSYLGANDWGGKVVAMWWPIFTFAAIGFEHIVANYYFIPLALMEGSPWTVGEVLSNNLIPVTFGNIIGGSIFVGVAEWIVYREKNAAPVLPTIASPKSMRKEDPSSSDLVKPPPYTPLFASSKVPSASPTVEVEHVHPDLHDHDHDHDFPQLEIHEDHDHVHEHDHDHDHDHHDAHEHARPLVAGPAPPIMEMAPARTPSKSRLVSRPSATASQGAPRLASRPSATASPIVPVLPSPAPSPAASRLVSRPSATTSPIIPILPPPAPSPASRLASRPSAAASEGGPRLASRPSTASDTGGARLASHPSATASDGGPRLASRPSAAAATEHVIAVAPVPQS